MNSFFKKIIILISFLFVISCSISSKSYVEQKIDKNNKNIISHISKQNSELENKISEIKILMDSSKYYYDQNSFLIKNLTNRYNLIIKEVSSLDAKKSLDINSIFKRMNSLDKKFQQLQYYVSKNENNSNQIQDTVIISDSKIASGKMEEMKVDIDTLFYKFNRLQNEFDLLVKDLSLIENSMMDIVKYSTNRVKTEINNDNEIIRQNVNNLNTNQDSLFNLYKDIVDSIDSLKINNNLMKNDTILIKEIQIDHKDSLDLNDPLQFKIE